MRIRFYNLIGILVCGLLLVNAGKIRYDNFKVFKVVIDNDIQLNVLNDLQKEPQYYKPWKPAKGIGSDADIMVHPKKIKEFEKILKDYNIKNEINIPDVQRLIDQEQPQQLKEGRAFGWESYYTLGEIYNWLDSIVDKYPDQVSTFVIGKSYQRRPIRGIKISYKSGNPGIFIEANIHAREWIASATATYVINALLSSQDQEIRQIAENIDWYIVPVFNVDGLAYSHETDRLWRKTVQPNPSSPCAGTDGNRNFDSHWMANGGASSNPCDETYAGPKPFSEPETKALAQFVRGIKDKISIYLSFHSYGQLLLSPYGHTAQEFPPNYQDMLKVSKAATTAIKKRYNTEFRYGSTASTLYKASGTSPDWAYNELQIPLAFTFEFRDTGKHGFVLPAEQIKPNCEETLDGLVALVNKAKDLNYL